MRMLEIVVATDMTNEDFSALLIQGKVRFQLSMNKDGFGEF